MQIWTWRSFLLASVITANCLSGNAALADVNTFTVDSVEDEIDIDTTDGVCMTASGQCTLRAAVMSANKASGVLATVIVPAGTYFLIRPAPQDPNDDRGGALKLLPPPVGSTPITITGIGKPVIDGSQIDSVLRVMGGRVASISGVTFRNGFSQYGGGIDNDGSLTLTDCTVTDNTASLEGGGIFNSNSLYAVQSTVAANHAVYGAGIYNTRAVKAIYSTLSGNIAQTGGGAAFSSGGGEIGTSGKLEIDYCLLTGNTALLGGAVAVNGPLTIEHSTVSGNHAKFGGGLYIDVLRLGISSTLAQDTISGNTADANGDPTGGLGGGIYAQDGFLIVKDTTLAQNIASGSGGAFFNAANPYTDVNFYNSTIAFNDADGDQDASGTGGGIYLQNSNGNGVNLYNTILAENTRGNKATSDDCGADATGVLKTHARNLFGEAVYCPTNVISGAFTLLTPLQSSLGPLQNNGGPTQTIALLPGSNAIDGTSVTGSVCYDPAGPLTIDQRDYPRTGACDVGAFEYDGIFIDGFQ